jgi:hypothetical protein
MQYRLDLPGFEGRSLTLHAGQIFSPAKLTIDGKPAPTGSIPGTLLLRRNDGVDITARLRYSVGNLLGDPIPVLQIGDRFILVVEPFKWYEWAWASFALLMVIFSGIPGFLIGAMAMQINLSILRWVKNDLARILISGFVSTIAVLLSMMLKNYINRK